MKKIVKSAISAVLLLSAVHSAHALTLASSLTSGAKAAKPALDLANDTLELADNLESLVVQLKSDFERLKTAPQDQKISITVGILNSLSTLINNFQKIFGDVSGVVSALNPDQAAKFNRINSDMKYITGQIKTLPNEVQRMWEDCKAQQRIEQAKKAIKG